MRRFRPFLMLALGTVLLEVSSTPALACAACFGQSDSSLARGMNMGIFALLLVITSVLCAVAGFFVFVARRTAHLEQTSPRLADDLAQH
jgi:hypothetical protein